MGGVDHHLGVGGVVDGGDHPVLDADLLVQHLDHRRQAVGGAGGGGNQVVLCRVVEVVVDPHDDVQRPLLDRGGDDHLFDAALVVGLQQLGGAELAGRFDDYIDPQLIPGDLPGACEFAEADPPPGDAHRVAFGLYLPVPAAVHRIEFQQVGGGFHPALELVDVDDVKFRPIPGGAQRQAAHAAETVNSYADAHLFTLLAQLYCWK